MENREKRERKDGRSALHIRATTSCKNSRTFAAFTLASKSASLSLNSSLAMSACHWETASGYYCERSVGWPKKPVVVLSALRHERAAAKSKPTLVSKGIRVASGKSAHSDVRAAMALAASSPWLCVGKRQGGGEGALVELED